MIYITKFRENDLNPSKGKQIEFNKMVVEGFFKFDKPESSAEFVCRSLSNPAINERIQVQFKLSPSRGDYKIYQNSDGSKDLKDFFVETLHLSANVNIGDYFAIKKVNASNYTLYYIPEGSLFSDFFPIISGDQILFVAEDTKEIIQSPSSLQRIYYGAPGTGKSHSVNELTNGESVIRTTFHPDSDYSTFVGTYKPTTVQEPRYTSLGDKAIKMKDFNGNDLMEDRIVYKFVPQAFLQAYVKAWKNYAGAEDGKPKKQFLVVEEINRGNCAQIFGDLFQLLDRNGSGFSEYPINADKDLQAYLAAEFEGLDIQQKDSIDGMYKTTVVDKVVSGEILLLPNNLYIWATMNTSDQSLFPIDSAFKRRWDWMYVPIANAAKGWRIEVGKGVYYDWWDFLEKINRHIYATTNSADKQLGYFFCKADDRKIISAETFVNKVIFYLWNDVFKDFGFGDDIFADNDDKEDSRLTFGKFYSGGKDGSASVVADKVAVLMDNLEVKKLIEEIDEDDEDDFIDEEDDTDDVSSQRDRSKYSVNGEGSYNKGELVRKVVELYIENHPGITPDKLIEDFEGVKVASRKKNFLNEAEYEEWLDSHSADKYREIRYRKVSKNGVNVYATTQIRIDFMDDFIEKVRSWGIEIKKVE